MKKTLFIGVLMLLLPTFSLLAQKIESNNRLNSGGYNYWLYTPGPSKSDTVENQAKPLVIFLHGKSLSGTDLNRVRRYGTIDAIERGNEIDAYVIAPQSPGGGWAPYKVWDIVEHVKATCNIDTNRIYCLGMSMGGYGTFSMASAYPDKIAAAMPLCGGGHSLDYAALNRIPIWIVHGTADKAVPESCSKNILKGMDNNGDCSRVRYTPLRGQNHSILARCFYLPQVYQWLFAHNLQDSNRVMCTDYDITVADLSGAYSHATQARGSVPVLRSSGAPVLEAPSTQASTSRPSSGKEYYTIKSGDTLSGIAKKKHTTVKKLCQLNGLSATSTLKVGKKIRVK